MHEPEMANQWQAPYYQQQPMGQYPGYPMHQGEEEMGGGMPFEPGMPPPSGGPYYQPQPPYTQHPPHPQQPHQYMTSTAPPPSPYGATASSPSSKGSDGSSSHNPYDTNCGFQMVPDGLNVKAKPFVPFSPPPQQAYSEEYVTESHEGGFSDMADGHGYPNQAPTEHHRNHGGEGWRDGPSQQRASRAQATPSSSSRGARGAAEASRLRQPEPPSSFCHETPTHSDRPPFWQTPGKIVGPHIDMGNVWEDLKSILEPEGFFYIRNFIGAQDADRLVGQIDKGDWKERRIDQGRSQQWGYTVDSARTLAAAPPIPPFISALCEGWNDKIHPDVDCRMAPPDQVAVYEHRPRDGMNSHIERTTLFGDVVCMLSLLSPIPIKLTRGSHSHNLLVEPKSLLILTGSARNSWRQGITGRMSDNLNGHTCDRRRRLCITFRNVLPTAAMTDKGRANKPVGKRERDRKASHSRKDKDGSAAARKEKEAEDGGEAQQAKEVEDGEATVEGSEEALDRLGRDPSSPRMEGGERPTPSENGRSNSSIADQVDEED